MYIVQGDHGIPIPFTVQKLSASENIEGATVEVAIHRGEETFTKAATITNAAKGECEFVLTSSDLTLFATYEWQWTAYFPDGRIYSGKARKFSVSERLIAGSAGGEMVPVIVPFATVEELEALRTEFEQGGGGAGGKSAYQIWLDAGHAGTEADFLNSLVGPQGPSGTGGTLPTNVILFEDWTGGESVTIDTVVVPPSDTTAPIVSISPVAGTYTSAQSVTLTSNETATIYFTTDGSTPTTASTVYSGAIAISATTTLKYFAKDTAGNSSAAQSAVFTVNIDTTAPVLTITAGGTFTGTKAVTMSVNETADIYYTIDGSTPTTSSTKYTSALAITATATVKAFAKDPSGNSSAVQTVTYTLDAGAPADTTAPTVTASPASGTFTSAQSVTLIADETATIYYTTNGTTPTTASTVYTGPVSISATTTLQFIAKDTAGNTSAPVAATYTINIPDTTAPVLTITPAATFADTQTVNMSANETATIWYTLDDTDPATSGTRLQYTASLTLTETDTVKAYAVDTTGNASTVQTVTYTKQQPIAGLVSDSLMVYYDGRDGDKTTQTPKDFWQDRGTNNFDGTISGTFGWDYTDSLQTWSARDGWSGTGLKNLATSYTDTKQRINAQSYTLEAVFSINIENGSASQNATLFGQRVTTASTNGLVLSHQAAGNTLTLRRLKTTSASNMNWPLLTWTAHKHYHVAIVVEYVDATTTRYKGYVNGSLIFNNTDSYGSTLDQTANLVIGGITGGTHLLGQHTMYSFRAYTKALTDAEVQANYTYEQGINRQDDHTTYYGQS